MVLVELILTVMSVHIHIQQSILLIVVYFVIYFIIMQQTQTQTKQRIPNVSNVKSFHPGAMP